MFPPGAGAHVLNLVPTHLAAGLQIQKEPDIAYLPDTLRRLRGPCAVHKRLQDPGTFWLSIGPLRPLAGASRAPLPARTCQQHHELPSRHAFGLAKGVAKGVAVTPKKFSKATASHCVRGQ